MEGVYICLEGVYICLEGVPSKCSDSLTCHPWNMLVKILVVVAVALVAQADGEVLGKATTSSHITTYRRCFLSASVHVEDLSLCNASSAGRSNLHA